MLVLKSRLLELELEKREAERAKIRGVHIEAGWGTRSGVGSPEGTTLTIDGYHIAIALNEPLLTEIADTTNGAYFRAEDETQIAQIYDSVNLGLTTPGERVEVTSVLALLAIVLLAAGATMNMRWFGRMP